MGTGIGNAENSGRVPDRSSGTPWTSSTGSWLGSGEVEEAVGLESIAGSDPMGTGMGDVYRNESGRVPDWLSGTTSSGAGSASSKALRQSREDRGGSGGDWLRGESGMEGIALLLETTGGSC